MSPRGAACTFCRMNILNQLSDAVSGVVSSLAPSLVTVVGKRVNATAIPWDEHHLVTARHNLSKRRAPIVRLPDGTERQAEVVGRDGATDLALLKIDHGLPVPSWADEGGRVGELVLALARPGSSPQASLGMVTSVGDAWRTRHGGPVDRYLEVDAELPMGFSGGPLVGADGSVLGLNTRGLLRGGATLPTPTVRRVLGQLEQHGEVRRHWLGLGLQPVEDGLLVSLVAGGSPAEAGGVLVGDIVTHAGGTAVTRPTELAAVLSTSIGQALELQLIRGGQPATVTVTPVEKPAARQAC